MKQLKIFILFLLIAYYPVSTQGQSSSKTPTRADTLRTALTVIEKAYVYREAFLESKIQLRQSQEDVFNLREEVKQHSIELAKVVTENTELKSKSSWTPFFVGTGVGAMVAGLLTILITNLTK